MKELEALRREINEVDAQLMAHFRRRMEIVEEIARVKRDEGLPIADAGRERNILARVSDLAGDKYAPHARAVYEAIFAASRAHQQGRRAEPYPLPSPGEAFPEAGVIACWGGQTEQACRRLFARPEIVRAASYEAVFQAVAEGLCAFGVLPDEEGVYELLYRYRLAIVRTVRMHAPGVYDARYFCLAKSVAIYPGASRASLLLGVPDMKGAVYGLLAPLASAGLDICGMRTGPRPDDGHTFMLYLELEGDVTTPEARGLLGALARENAHFAFLGAYGEA